MHMHAPEPRGHPHRHPLGHDHDHVFGQDMARAGESRTLIVIGVTASMMIIEIATGLAFGSMALLADGLHMASHAAALAIAYFAYVYARRHARDARFSFGTGKVNALGGYTGAVLLGVFALMMAAESIHRLINPVQIEFNYAIGVAVVGLAVNAVSALILDVHDHGHHHHDDEHDHDHDHDHDHHGHEHGHDDHNLRAAYLHVLADALTSVLAIFALLCGKYLGQNWMDPAMGILGSILVAIWARGLLTTTSRTLLDHGAPDHMVDAVRRAIESDADRLSDLHIWSIGPGIYAAELAVLSREPRSPDHYKARLPDDLPLVHVTCEVRRQ